MTVALVTFAVGLAAGFLAQRSRLCFIGGLRDFLLIRDTDLLKGALAFFLAAWLTFPLAALAGLPVWAPAEPAGVPAAASGAIPATPGESPAPSGDNPVNSATRQGCFGRTSGDPGVLTLLMVLAGIGLGVATTLSNGCPLRQHVLAVQGGGDSRWWLGGFYAGAVVYHTVLLPLLARCV